MDKTTLIFPIFLCYFYKGDKIMIIKDLFANLAILISLIFLYMQFAKPLLNNGTSAFIPKVTLGVFGGLLGNILMYYSISIKSTIIDLRHIPILLLSFYGGTVPTLICGLLIIGGRFLISVNASANMTIVSISIVTLSTLYIAKRTRISQKAKIIWSLTFAHIILSSAISLLIKDGSTLLLLIPFYWIISYLSCFIAFYTIEHLKSSAALFNRYKSESSTDGLTGLNNYRKFDEVFNGLLKEANLKGEKLSLLYIDIDFFKKVNDTYGHKEGDIVLKELGNILKKYTRSFDIVSRNGGEEFTVILLDCPLDRSLVISERIRRNVEDYAFMLSSGTSINITVSIGVACFNETTKAAAALMEDADKALYQAKQTGRNKVCVS